MLRILPRTLALATLLALPGFSQHFLQHYDGTTEATSRGAIGTDNKGLFQRLPADQICGAVNLTSLVMIIQDQSAATPEGLTVEVRTNNPLGPATGSPDITPAGVLGSIVVPPIAFPAPGPSAFILTVTFPVPGLAVPASGGGVPADDLYVGINAPAQPAWTADGLSMHISAALAPSPGEQFRTSAIGYTGVAGTAGLGWDVNFTTGAVALGSANRAWDIGTFFAQDTLQPFADNAGVFTGVGGTGLNPNFGYAGIWADPARGDALGLFLDSGSAPGSSIIVAFDVVSAPPLAIPGVDGNLCLSLATLAILFPPPAFVTTAPPAGAGSIATIGPFPLAGFAGFGNAYLQAATVDAVTGAIRLSTLARVNL